MVVLLVMVCKRAHLRRGIRDMGMKTWEYGSSHDFSNSSCSKKVIGGVDHVENVENTVTV